MRRDRAAEALRIYDASLVSLKLDAGICTVELRLSGVTGERLCFLFGDIEMLTAQGL